MMEIRGQIDQTSEPYVVEYKMSIDPENHILTIWAYSKYGCELISQYDLSGLRIMNEQSNDTRS